MPVFEYEGRRVEFVGDYTGSYDCINKGRFYELPFLEHIRSLGLSGTYLDIGTNIGNHALYFSMFCPTDHVVAFEPVRKWRERAMANLDANGQSGKVRMIPYGLSDRREEIAFKPYDTVFWLECAPLDAFCRNVDGVSFVKMDIEGSEPKALLGATEFLKRNRPVITAEVLGDPAEITAAAEAVGYCVTGTIFPSTAGSPMFELLPV